MTKRRPNNARVPPPPAHAGWVRRSALVCLLLAAVIGTVQAVHIHGDWLPQARAQLHTPSDSSQPGGEEHCPLCVAMHATLPVALQVGPTAALLQGARLVESERPAQDSLWHFALFSRPPPALA